MEFSFDLDVTPKPKFDPNATMFATLPGQVADLGNGECIFRPRHEDLPHVMTHQVLSALDCARLEPALAQAAEGFVGGIYHIDKM